VRTLTTLFKAAAKSDSFVFGVATEMQFPSGVVRLNTSPYTIQINGNNFSGVGALGAVSAVSEESSLTATGINLTLSGIDPTTLGAALNDNPQGRPCSLWVCLFDQNHLLIPDPYPVGVWRMDTMKVAIGNKATITLSAESALTDWERPRLRYYTDGDQQARYPGDKFFEFLAPNIDRTILWGRS